MDYEAVLWFEPAELLNLGVSWTLEARMCRGYYAKYTRRLYWTLNHNTTPVATRN